MAPQKPFFLGKSFAVFPSFSVLNTVFKCSYFGIVPVEMVLAGQFFPEHTSKNLPNGRHEETTQQISTSVSTGTLYVNTLSEWNHLSLHIQLKACEKNMVACIKMTKIH